MMNPNKNKNLRKNKMVANEKNKINPWNILGVSFYMA